MTEHVRFTLDGREVEAASDETIWQVAQRLGTDIPHLCYAPEPGYRADGNCRACMVEIEGERTLTASCVRKPAAGMVVKTASDRAETARAMVMELLIADQPAKADAHDPSSKLWSWAERIGVTESRFPAHTPAEVPAPDPSHPAMRVNLDACIHCNLCVRACREVQVNDVIGMSGRGHHARISFDFDDPMGASTCVACGECVQACPTGALMEARLLGEDGVRVAFEEETIQSGCPFCGVGCQIDYHVADGKILYADGAPGPANQNRLCVKGRFGFDYQSSPERLTVPLIRRDDAPKDTDLRLDPANPYTHFREATWEEALDRAAAGLKTVIDQDGPSALAGFGSAKCSNEEAYLFQKLVRVGFGTNNVDHCTRLCHASSVAALMEAIGTGAVTAPFNAAADAEVIIVIGANPTENHPVAATFIKNAAKAGKRLYVMDPRRQMLSRHATRHLQFKPGADVALLNAMIHTIIEENLYDRQYVAARTHGFEELVRNVRQFPPEKMEEVCGIPAEVIREVARDYARSEASIIFWGMGVSQHVHGTDNARCLIQLALITGQVGRPGTGLHPLRGQNNVQGASDAGLIPMVYPDYQSVAKAEIRNLFEDFWGTDLDPEPGLTVVEIMDAIHADEIKAMYVLGENPAMSDPDQNHARAALAKLDHLVVQDIFLTETAYYADVILPATSYYEKWGTFTNTNRQVQIGEPVVAPPGQARPDWHTVQEIARRLGLDWAYEGPAQVFAEMSQVMPSLNNITWDRLVRERCVTYPCDSEDGPGSEILFAESFPTEDGRAKIVPTNIVPPDELPDADYPMVLTTGRLLEHWHTGAMTRRASVLEAIEPEPTVAMNPRQLRDMGLEAGDTVRVSTRRGEIELKARRDRNVPQGMLFIPFCFEDAAANKLTNPQLDPFGKIPEFKFCAARVERVGETAEAAQ
ncbi:formate dehydrogenase subunit alpha [Microbaculum marinisediminis]|uniref:Formate dehydrogenase subunit alpha n=1 Tax=Microbaculum marinisediminis TaxID=2931392 RepID=A0AAW5R4M8_9HYPH|nr:formate dehydrogenase subunit alpha [Microbaculum sp. A6E488]MCT8974739.1 formate dehydrogenase subunit alpha [Microbaculum sp. A6E488]